MNWWRVERDLGCCLGTCLGRVVKRKDRLRCETEIDVGMGRHGWGEERKVLADFLKCEKMRDKASCTKEIRIPGSPKSGMEGWESHQIMK